MGWLKKIRIRLKFRNKRFAHLGRHPDIFHLDSRFIRPEKIRIGDFCKIGEGAYVDGSGGVTIGRCTIIGPHVTIITANHRYEETDLLPFDNVMLARPVTIGPYCWIGRGVMILPGVTVGEAAVIAAGSVVTKDVEPYAVVGGNPARLIKKRDIAKTRALIEKNRCVSDPSINPSPKKVWR